jgi:hypothetical protein
MGDGLLLLPSEGDNALTCPGLIQGLACSNHNSDESLLLSVHGSGVSLSRSCSLSHSRGIVLLSLSDGGGRGGVRHPG